MRTAVLALLLTIGAGLRADDLRLFYDGATPLPATVQQALKATLEHDHVPQTGILIAPLGMGMMDVGSSFTMAVVFLPARESTAGVCRGSTKLYGFDDETKWTFLDDKGGTLPTVTYFFKPAMKLKCERLLAQPTLIMGTVADADILAIIDSIQSGRIEKAFEGSVTFPRGGRIKVIARDEASDSTTVFLGNRRLSLNKHDSQWWVIGADEADQ
jgi:hypothetical protein